MQNSKLPVTKKRKITCNSGLTLKGADLLINDHEQSDLECISFSNPISCLVKNYRNIEKFHKKYNMALCISVWCVIECCIDQV